MKPVNLTKSNFKLGTDCLFKLKYYKEKYPSTLNNNEMLKFFADGGFMVEAIAHAVMSANPSVVFEKTLEAGFFSARIDAFEQSPEQIILTEIKAKSVKSSDPDQFFNKRSRTIAGDWRDYMLDITFQVMVAELQFPNALIVPQLCLVNSSTPCSIEAVYANVELVPDTGQREFSLPSAVYTGDVDRLRSDHFLEFINVRECVDILMNEVKKDAEEMLGFLQGTMPSKTPELSFKKCKNCEYRDADTTRDGFTECWGSTPTRGSHIIDLFRAGNGNSELQAEIVDRIASRKFNLVDLPEHFLDNGRSYEAPRRNQLAATQTGKEVFSAELGTVLKDVDYPLYFIDFEASRIPVPYHAGMKPYELIAFQFSCHVIESPESTELIHHEWLNLYDVYPNEEFLQQLQKTIGNTGTVFVWSHYEATLLKEVRRQLSERGLFTSAMDQWLTSLLGSSINEEKSVKPRIIDLLKVSEAHYYHPLMAGSHSIKRVLDAVWSEAKTLWNDPWFVQYYTTDAGGDPIDPYKTLAIPDSYDYFGDSDESDEYAVTDGVGAMRAYQDMLFGLNKDNLVLRDTMRDSLLDYCKLDTAAMVMIWKYWHHLANI
jgi:hypothetical protein